MEAHELGPQLEGCDTDYRITIEAEQRVKIVIRWRHMRWAPRQQGCDTDYRTTIETEQSVKVVISHHEPGTPAVRMRHRL